MGFREYIKQLSDEGKLVKVKKEISKNLEISGLLKAMEPAPIIFEKAEYPKVDVNKYIHR